MPVNCFKKDLNIITVSASAVEVVRFVGDQILGIQFQEGTIR